MPKLNEEIKILWLCLKHGRILLICKEVLHRLYSDELHFGLRFEINVTLRVSDAKIPIKIRPLCKKDISKVFTLNERGIANKEFKDRLNRLFFVKTNIPTCYVAVTKNDTPCHVHWLIKPSNNEKIQSYFKGGFPKLAADEVLFEGGFTPEAYRDQKIMPKAMHLIVEKSKRCNARWAIGFVHNKNIPSLKAMKKAGFKPFMIRHDSWRLFRRKASFISLPPGTPYSFDS